MNKLKVGMEFAHLKEAFEYLGISDEYKGSPKGKELKFSEFCNWHRKGRLAIVIDEVFDKRKVIYHRKNYTLDDLRDNFLELCKRLGKTPSYNEFKINKNISMPIYVQRLNLPRKNQYEELIKIYLSEDEKVKYHDELYKRKRLHGLKYSNNFVSYSLEYLEENFKSIFDNSYNKYGTYPSRRVFNELSKIDESVYRKRLNKNWIQICNHYGYQVESNYKSEKLALELCKEILKCDYTPQKTFNWLINDRKHHLFCDGYFDKLDLVVEFDGSFHRKPYITNNGIKTPNHQIENDRLKDKLLSEHGITVVRIDSRLKWYTIDGMMKILTNQLKDMSLILSA